MSDSIPLTFLGTGNAFAPGHDWNAFLVGDRILIETAPTVLPNLHRLGVDRQTIQVIFLSHFHADHSFGWPFLLLDFLAHRRTNDLWVVGPPGIRAFLEQMLRAAAFDHILQTIRSELGGFPLHYVEVNEEPQEAGGVCFRGVRVDHDPKLDCYGFLIQQAGRSLGYSGDTRLCSGLRELAASSDALVLEASARHGVIGGHMDLGCVRRLREEFPKLPFVLTHTGEDIDPDGMPHVCLARDLETLRV